MNLPVDGGCGCGVARYQFDGQPLMRLICHCTLCQRFNQAPFADVTLFRMRAFQSADRDKVQFGALKFPPLVQRGRCRSCDKPAWEEVRLPLMPALTLVPTAGLSDPANAPAASLHMFYEHRVADIEDSLPKHSGFLPSQLAFLKHLFGALRHST